MRLPAADYLEAAKVEDLVDELNRGGYRVEREAQVGAEVFDVLAQRGNERLVFEVKARSRLKEAAEQVARLRDAALDAQVDRFQLVIVNPPRETEVAIDGLDGELLGYFIQELPPELDALSYETMAKHVKLYEIDAVDVRHEANRVRGRAALDVELNFRGKTDRIDMTVDEGLDFTFDVELGHDLKLARVNEIKIDLSDFADADE